MSIKKIIQGIKTAFSQQANVSSAPSVPPARQPSLPHDSVEACIQSYLLGVKAAEYILGVRSGSEYAQIDKEIAEHISKGLLNGDSFQYGHERTASRAYDFNEDVDLFRIYDRITTHVTVRTQKNLPSDYSKSAAEFALPVEKNETVKSKIDSYLLGVEAGHYARGLGSPTYEEIKRDGDVLIWAGRFNSAGFQYGHVSAFGRSYDFDEEGDTFDFVATSRDAIMHRIRNTRGDNGPRNDM